MKRSRRIALVTMSAAGLSLAACEEENVSAQIYETVDQCVQDALFSEEQCRTDFAATRAMHEEVAPKYTSRADCEADFGAGQCEVSENYSKAGGGGVFMPFLAGYLMGNMLAGGGRSAATQPLYRSADDRSGFRTGQNVRVGNGVGTVTAPKSAVSSVKTNLSAVPRGGFGASARAFGSARS